MANPTLSLERLPDDVCLSLLEHCDGRLETWIALALTCKRFAPWFGQRIFWISALSSTRQRKPIACSLHHDLGNCSLEELKDIAHRTMRLRRNWSLPRPQPIVSSPTEAACTVFNLGSKNLDVIFQVPGTQLFLMHSSDDGGYIACWDMAVGKRVTEPLPAFQRLLDVSGGVDEPGCFSMAMLTQEQPNETNHLAVVCLEYGSRPGDEIKVTYTFQRALTPGYMMYWDVFLTRNVVGLMMPDPDKNSDRLEDPRAMQVSIFDRASGTSTSVQVTQSPEIADIMPARYYSRSGSVVVNGDFYHLIEDGVDSILFKCADLCPDGSSPAAAAPASSTDKPQFKEMLTHFSAQDTTNLFKAPIRHQLQRTLDTTAESEGVLTTNPFYGVAIVGVRKVADTHLYATEDSDDAMRRLYHTLHNPALNTGADTNETPETAISPYTEDSAHGGTHPGTDSTHEPEPADPADLPAGQTAQGGTDTDPTADGLNLETPLTDGFNAENQVFITNDWLEVQFWTIGKLNDSMLPTEGPTSDAGSGLVPQPSLVMPGTIHEGGQAAWCLFLIPHSGRVMAAVMDTPTSSKPELCLARFDPDTKKSSLHVLDVPKEVVLTNMRGFTVDDHCGIVSFLDEEGSIFIIRYA